MEIVKPIKFCKKELEESKQRSATLKNEKREETSKVKKHSLGEEISENNLKIDEQERYITKLIEIRNRKEKSILFKIPDTSRMPISYHCYCLTWYKRSLSILQ